MAAPPAARLPLTGRRSKEDGRERRRHERERNVNIHRDTYSVVIAMLILAGLITILLAVVNPIR